MSEEPDPALEREIAESLLEAYADGVAAGRRAALDEATPRCAAERLSAAAQRGVASPGNGPERAFPYLVPSLDSFYGIGDPLRPEGGQPGGGQTLPQRRGRLRKSLAAEGLAGTLAGVLRPGDGRGLRGARPAAWWWCWERCRRTPRGRRSTTTPWTASWTAGRGAAGNPTGCPGSSTACGSTARATRRPTLSLSKGTGFPDAGGPGRHRSGGGHSGVYLRVGAGRCYSSR